MVRLQNFEKLTASTIINQKPHLLVHILVLDGSEMTVLVMAICPQRSHFSSSYALETLFALGTDNVRGQITEDISARNMFYGFILYNGIAIYYQIITVVVRISWLFPLFTLSTEIG